MMNYSTGTVPSCGYCGKPVIGVGVWSFGVAYHPECTCGPSAEFAKESGRIADLQRQLADAKADILEQHLQDEECRKAAGEFDKSDSLGVESPLTIIKRMKAGIEAMRPMVERYRWLRSNDRAPSITGIWYGDFTLDKAIDEARKQP